MKNFYNFFSFISIVLLCLFLNFNNVKSVNYINHKNSKILKNNSLNLNQVLVLALKNNLNIEIFNLKRQQSKEKIYQSKSHYWPQISLEGSINAENNLIVNKEENLRFYNLRLNSYWLIFDGFKRSFETKTTKLEENISIASLENTKIKLLISASELFHRAQFFIENIKIAINDENFHKNLLVEAKEKFKLGSGSLSDILNFEIKLNNAKIFRLKQEENYKTTMINLASILGISNPKFPYYTKLTSFIPIKEKELKPPNYAEMIKLSLRNNPKIVTSKINIRKAQAQIKIKIAEKYPKIYFNASIDAKNIENIILNKDNFTTNFILKISYNLFSGGLYNSLVREARKEKIKNKKIMNKIIISEKTKIGSIYLKICYTQAQIISQRENLNLIKQTRNFIEKEYKVYNTSLVRLNEIQNELIKSRSKLNLIILTLRQLKTELKITTGEYAI